MKMVRNPNAWSCVPACFAMLLDIDINTMLDRIGHDGSEHVFKGPRPWKSFHLAECYRIALYYGYSCTQFPLHAKSSPDGSQVYSIPKWNDWMQDMMSESEGILLGRGKHANHAIAWDGELSYDPATGLISKSLPFNAIEYIRFDLIF